MLPDRQQRIKSAINAALKEPRKKTLLTEKSRVPWGKYKGECVKAILRHDPQYLQWLISQDTIACDTSLRNALNTQLELAR